MKKTFRMTLLLCLVVAAMLMITACLPKGPAQQTTPEVTTPEATTPAHVHTEEILSAVAATCTEIGKTEGKKCSACGDILQEQEEIAATGHSFGEWVETKAPTIKEDGEQTRSCANCDEIETNVLAKLEDPDKPEGSTLVENIAGVSAQALLKNFADSFATATSYNFEMNGTVTEDGATSPAAAILQYCDGETHIWMNNAGAITAFWFVDGVVYIDYEGKKMRMPAESLDEVVGDGFFASLQETLTPTISDTTYEKIAAANIYLLDSLYVVTVHYSEEEATAEDPDAPGAYTEKFYFNAAGTLVKVENIAENETAVFTIHSYNEPVLIEAPENAKEYLLPGMIEVEVPEGSVPVDTVNGMTALELIEKYFTDFKNADTLDIEIIMTEAFEGEEIEIIETMKLGEDSVYIYVEMLGETTEMWFVDGVAYIRSGEYRIKQENVTYEEFLGDGFWESINSSLIREMPELYYAYVAEVQLYELDGEYFFILCFSMPEEGLTSYYEAIYFNENGRVTKTIAYFTDEDGNEYSITGIYHSYGEPVEVLPPEDADEFLTEDEMVPEEPEYPEEPEIPELPETQEDIYALYTEMCTTLQGATHYVLDLYVNDEYVANYALANGDLYLGRLNNGILIEQWLIGGVGYSAINYGTPAQTEVDAAFWETVFNFEDILPIGVISQDVMSNLRCTYDEYYGEVVVWFDIIDDDGNVTQCKYALFEMEGYAPYIEVIHTFIEGGEVVQEDYFFFDYINDPSVEITLPEIG